MYIDSKFRTISKTISWRIFATLATMALVYVFTKNLDITAMVGGIEVFAKLVLYFFHERIWGRIHAGKKEIEPFVIWFTGLSGSGKSTLAAEIYKYLEKQKYKVEKLDGDVVRSVLPRTGFSKEERNNHIRRVGYLASILEKNGICVIAAFISPYKESRDFVRSLCSKVITVYVSTPLEECEKRDVKGLYLKARKGEIKNFTGIDDPYEEPENPEIVINTTGLTTHEAVKEIKNKLKRLI